MKDTFCIRSLRLLQLQMFSECHFHYVELSTREKYICEISFNVAASCVCRISQKRETIILRTSHILVDIFIPNSNNFNPFYSSYSLYLFVFNCIFLYRQVISAYNNSNIFNLNIIDNNPFFFFRKVFSVSELSRIRGLMKLYK